MDKRSRKAHSKLLPETLDLPASSEKSDNLSGTIKSSDSTHGQLEEDELTNSQVPDFTGDQAKSQLSELKKRNGNDFAVIALTVTVFSFLPLGFFSLPPFSTILHATSLVMVVRMGSGKLTPSSGWVTVGIITGVINSCVLIGQLALLFA